MKSISLACYLGTLSSLIDILCFYIIPAMPTLSSSTAGFRSFDGKLQSCLFRRSALIKTHKVSAAVMRIYHFISRDILSVICKCMTYLWKRM
jgi:hypothetical protein